MFKHNSPANSNAPDPLRRQHTDSDTPSVWSEDEDKPTGRSWSLILVFIFVPLMALVVLGLCLYALFMQIFSPSV